MYKRTRMSRWLKENPGDEKTRRIEEQRNYHKDPQWTKGYNNIL